MEETDLFQNVDQLPQEVKEIVNEYADQEYLEYSEVAIFLNRIEALGYTFEYGLDSIPFNLTPCQQ